MTSGRQIRFVTSVAREVIFIRSAQSGRMEILLVTAEKMMLAAMGSANIALGMEHASVASRKHTRLLLYLSQKLTGMNQMGPDRALLQHVQLSGCAHRWMTRDIELFVPWYSYISVSLPKSYIADIFSAKQWLRNHAICCCYQSERMMFQGKHQHGILVELSCTLQGKLNIRALQESHTHRLVGKLHK